MQRVRWMIWAGLLASLAGCGAAQPAPAKSGDKPAGAAQPAAELSAQQILKRLLETYRGANSYADDGVVRLHFMQQGQPMDQEWKSSVRLARPSKLALDAFQAVVRCDGRELAARIEDEATGNIDNQVLVRPAPKELSLKDLAGDPLLYDMLASQLRRQPIQLELLLESSGLAAAFGQDIACRRLDDGNSAGHDCFRVEVPSPGGVFVFWIDQEKFLLRRLDYPAAALLPDLAQDASVSDLALWAELREPRVNEPIAADEFTLEIPADARRMKSFVVPPRPLPSKLFGQEPGEFFFTTLEEGKLTREDLAGKVAVLVWYRDHEACRGTLVEVAKFRQELADNEKVTIHAVSTDPTTESNEDLSQRLKDWQAELPVVRDLEAFGDSLFHIEAQPTVVVLDAVGRVQIFQAGGSPELSSQLATIVARLQKGENIAEEIVHRAEEERQQYDKLVASGGPPPQAVMELPEAVIKARSQPQKLKLRELWTCRELKSPGNVYAIAEGDDARLVVIDGVRAMAELDQSGKLLARRELDLPAGAAVTYVRTARDADGKRWYAASAPLSPQVYLLDDQWQTQRTYPEQLSPAPVADVQLADLTGDDGLVLYVGFVGEAGLHTVSLEGKPIRRNKTFPNVVSIAVAPADDVNTPRLLLTGDDGTILGINRFGNEQPPKTVGKWPIARIVAARFTGATQAAFIGMSGDRQGNALAVGCDAKLQEHWNYPLPPGIHQVPIEAITSGSLLPARAGEWIFAAPDGSIHVVSEDGEFTDTWNYGAALTGIAAARLGKQRALIVATQEGVTAWGVE
jgi:hypothetical protein